jgi:hypothetical protein
MTAMIQTEVTVCVDIPKATAERFMKYLDRMEQVGHASDESKQFRKCVYDALNPVSPVTSTAPGY